MKHQPAIQYFEGNMPAQGLSLQLSAIDEFTRYIQLYNIHVVFLLRKNEALYFACMQQGLFIGYPASGYYTLEDYRESGKAGFPDARLFYEAKTNGYSNYSDYQLVKEAGIADVQLFEKIKLQGYIEGYQEFKAMQSDKAVFSGSGNITNPYQLYMHASSKAFVDYQHFKAASDLGFSDAYHYNSAIEKGYKNSNDYEEGMHKGFPTGPVYYEALEKEIRDMPDLEKYSALTKLETAAANYDERLLLSVISKLPQGKKISINKLNELFKEALELYKYADTSEMPSWFSRSLFKAADITRFFETTQYARKFGFYDPEGEFFETKQLNQRKVLLDGANVAHAATGNGKAKPLVANMIKVVNKLISKGFTEISIIADASLRHRLTDKERMEELEKICEYGSAPAETAADVFLIEFVKAEACLLVTNDTFREWKLKDKWVAENIDYYKMAFMIEGDHVLMPDLDSVGM